MHALELPGIPQPDFISMVDVEIHNYMKIDRFCSSDLSPSVSCLPGASSTLRIKKLDA